MKCNLGIIYNHYFLAKRAKQALFIFNVLDFMGRAIRHVFNKKIRRCRVNNFPCQKSIISKFKVIMLDFLLSSEVY